MRKSFVDPKRQLDTLYPNSDENENDLPCMTKDVSSERMIDQGSDPWLMVLTCTSQILVQATHAFLPISDTMTVMRSQQVSNLTLTSSVLLREPQPPLSVTDICPHLQVAVLHQ